MKKLYKIWNDFSFTKKQAIKIQNEKIKYYWIKFEIIKIR